MPVLGVIYMMIKDLSYDDLVRVEELSAYKDAFKEEFLLEKEKNQKLDLGERMFLDFFLAFEKGEKSSDFSDQRINAYRMLYDIMSAGFEIGRYSVSDTGVVDMIYANREDKSFIFVELDGNNDFMIRTKMVTPTLDDENQSRLSVFTTLPHLDTYMQNHEAVNWPDWEKIHEEFFLTIEEEATIDNMQGDLESKKIQKMVVDSQKLVDLPECGQIIGESNKFLIDCFLFNYGDLYEPKVKSIGKKSV